VASEVVDWSFCQSWMESIGWSFGVPTLTHGARRLKCYQGRRPKTAGEVASEVVDWSFCQSWMESIGWSFGVPTLTHGARRLKCCQGRRPNTVGEGG
jgi:hypothetical protein